MHKYRWILTTAALVLLLTPSWGFDALQPTHKLFRTQTQVFQVVDQYWCVQDAFYQAIVNPGEQSEETYFKAIEIYQKLSVDLGKTVLANLKVKDRDVIELLSAIYRSFDEVSRQAFYPALGYLKVELAHESKVLTEEEFREYFPGYGYTEPGFKYRKGREIDREFKGHHWQSEEQSISTTWNVKLTISIDLLDILKGLVTGGAIKDLKVGKEFSMEVNGQPMICVEVSFQRVKTIATKTNRKFEVNKIWFELLRAQSGAWSTGPWEVCGKTYEIVHEPTGEEVVTNIVAQ